MRVVSHPRLDSAFLWGTRDHALLVTVALQRVPGKGRVHHTMTVMKPPIQKGTPRVSKWRRGREVLWCLKGTCHGQEHSADLWGADGVSW